MDGGVHPDSPERHGVPGWVATPRVRVNPGADGKQPLSPQRLCGSGTDGYSPDVLLSGAKAFGCQKHEYGSLTRDEGLIAASAAVNPQVTGAVSILNELPQPVQPTMVPRGSQLSGLFPVTDVDASITVPPELKMPPPWAAVLPVTWL